MTRFAKLGLMACLMTSVAGPGVAYAAPGDGAALIAAAQAGRDAQVTALLARHANVDATDGNGATALAWAVMRGNTALAQRLLAAHANPNLADANNVGPLVLAIENGAPDMVKLLLEKGADANMLRGNGETPLMVAVHAGSADMVSALLAHRADVNAREPQFGQTALMWAAGQPAIVKMLLDQGADTKPVTKSWDVTSVIYTPSTGTLGVTGIPWNNDGTYTAKSGGLNALMFAVQKGDIESVKMLLAAGMDVNQASADGTTPLLASLYNWQFASAANGQGPGTLKFSADFKIASLLLDKGAKVDVSDRAGYTPLHGAIVALVPAGGGRRAQSAAPEKITLVAGLARGRGAQAAAGTVDRDEAMTVIKRLLDMGADPNKATLYPTAGPVGLVRVNPAPPGSTPLHVAGQVPNVALADLLFARGADANKLRQDGLTPFAVAVKSDNLAVVKDMVGHGADVKMIYNPSEKLADPVLPKAEMRRNQTVLHIAAGAGASTVVEYLASQRVPLDAVNDHGETALQLADNQELYRYRKAVEGGHGYDGNADATRQTATTAAFKRAMGIKEKVASK